MITVSQAECLLRQAVVRAEVRVAAYLASKPTSTDPAGDESDHIAAVAGDLADAIDALVPGLGLRFMSALHPNLDLRLDEELFAAALLSHEPTGAMQ
jgi:hypothetical protein